MGLRQGGQAGAFTIRKATFGPDQDGPWAGAGVGQCASRSGFGLITKHQLAVWWPMIQQAVEFLHFRDFGDERSTALFGGFNRVGLQPVLADAFGIGEFGLNRQDPRGAHLGRFFDNEICTRLFDRGEEHPQIRRVHLWCGLLPDPQLSAALSGLGHLGQPFAGCAIEQQHAIAHGLTHNPKKIMRLIPVQRNGLPRPKRVVYKQPDFRFHESLLMQGNAQTPDGQVADAVDGNWVDTYAPAFARPYLRLSRADRPIGTWLLLLPCWWGLALAMLWDQTPRWEDLWIATGCAMGAFLMRGAGCTWNDITDRDFDAQVARTRSRPLPSGQVTVKQAVAWMVVQALLSLIILLTFDRAAIAMGVLALFPVAIYPFAKRFTWWPQAFLGLAFNWGALLAWTAHTGALHWPAVILYLAGIAWTLFYDTIYAHQDTEDDALIGVKSTARLFGQDTGRWLKYFLVATVALMGWAVINAVMPNGSILALVIALAGPWAMGWHMAWQIRGLDLEDSAKLIQLFRVNRDTGLIPLIFFLGALLV